VTKQAVQECQLHELLVCERGDFIMGSLRHPEEGRGITNEEFQAFRNRRLYFYTLAEDGVK
jgi:hypothetical protein